MKQAKRVILIAAAAIAALTVPATSFAKGPSVAAQGFNGTVSAIPHKDGTQPMPPYPGLKGTVSTTRHMDGTQPMPPYPGFNGTVSTTPHIDGTQPMPPYPG